MTTGTHSLRNVLGNQALLALAHAAPQVASIGWLRVPIRQMAEKGIIAHRKRARRTSPLPPGVEEERALMWVALLRTVERALVEKRLSPMALKGLLDIFVQRIMLKGGERLAAERFRAQYGTYPPALLTISPGKACNLHCPGCWADAGPASDKLDWDVVDRIISEAKALWGARFFVLTGGEPLAYRSGGKGVLDLAQKHNDCFFMMYTNGTLITDELAARLAEMGNLTPAVSLEGWREQTDRRRGEGVFDQVVTAMGHLRRYGVLFGISLTATRYNYEEILSDAFVDFCFNEQGALYGWIFQYMPIGRSITLNLSPTPEQRLWMWQRIRELGSTRHLFFADFWNQGTLTEGCIAAGRSSGGGYLYIDWNGAISPCVFTPYAPTNIKEVYARGGTLNDVWAEPFFVAIRRWQAEYRQRKGNWMMPCPNRDHYADLRRLLATYEPDPLDDNAREAMLDPAYAQGLQEYDLAYQQLSEDIWKQQYLRPGA